MYKTYADYIKHQKEKTLNKEWITFLLSNWHERKSFFKTVFNEILVEYPEMRGMKAIGIGARYGHEIEAMNEVGFDGIGVDLVARLPLVIEGDFHKLFLNDNSFDFVFTNSFDHALYPDKMISEIIRISKNNSIVLLHLAIGDQLDRYSINHIRNSGAAKKLFQGHEVLRDEAMKPWGGLNWKLIVRIKK
jgi:hypothetical protein